MVIVSKLKCLLAGDACIWGGGLSLQTSLNMGMNSDQHHRTGGLLVSILRYFDPNRNKKDNVLLASRNIPREHLIFHRLG